MRRALFLLPAFALIAQAQDTVRLQAPEAWSRLQIPNWLGKSSDSHPKLKWSPKTVPSAVVEVRDRDAEQEIRDFTLNLTTEVHALLQVPTFSLSGIELGAFMAEATKAHPNFSKALVDTAIEFWHPRPISLSGGSYNAGPIGSSHDTSRRGPFGQ